MDDDQSIIPVSILSRSVYSAKLLLGLHVTHSCSLGTWEVDRPDSRMTRPLGAARRIWQIGQQFPIAEMTISKTQHSTSRLVATGAAAVTSQAFRHAAATAQCCLSLGIIPRHDWSAQS